MNISIIPDAVNGLVITIAREGKEWTWTTGLIHEDARDDYPEALRRALRDYLAQHLESRTSVQASHFGVTEIEA